MLITVYHSAVLSSHTTRSSPPKQHVEHHDSRLHSLPPLRACALHTEACLLLPPPATTRQPRRTTLPWRSKRRRRLLPPRKRKTRARGPPHGRQQPMLQQQPRRPLPRHLRLSLGGRCSFTRTCCWWVGSRGCSIAITACGISVTPSGSSVRGGRGWGGREGGRNRREVGWGG